eukprot:TRINITY_DN1201_c0_g2_i1.p1 TRINITY_DN1201_c0_g2~~TRINITY_DN1201_c0_g2_i1.p1  ORF type:complete len:509 (-),score=121.14 TRINITY_DN1201_c0_g2_i1:112-1638(-)
MATGGFLEFFLTPSEKDAFAVWREVIVDRSFLVQILDPIFTQVAKFIPATVAPNAITLSGAVAVLQAWYFCEVYHEEQPRLVTFVNIVSLSFFWACGWIDGKHARRIMNDTSLGGLFKYVCDLISSIFIVIVLCSLLLEFDMDTQWYCVQSVQLVLLMKHYSAFVREAGLRYFLIGPSELLSWAWGLLAVRGIFGLGWLRALYDLTWGLCCNQIARALDLASDGYLASMSPARGVWVVMMTVCLGRIYLGGSVKHRWTRNSLMMILLLRMASGFFRIDVMVDSVTNRRDVVLDGLFLAMVTSDLVVAKMASRELHWWVVLMATMVVLPHLQFVILCFVVFYYIAIFADLMNHMNMPLLQVCKNVYCDGIYDLCHVGHKNLFRKALKLGNRLFVGVVGDEDANNYKRPPVMTAKEREAEVASCKCVTKIIKNAPCFGLTEDFILQHRIHIVAFGEEYAERYPNPDDDPYYKVPRKMGIGVPMPRTQGLSTSELISRIQARGEDKKKSPT